MNHVISIPKADKGNSEAVDKEQSYLIRNNGFFPDIDLQEVRHTMRTDGTVTNTRLRSAIIEAMASVNEQLHNIPHKFDELTLADIPAENIDNESILVIRYKRAVFCFALANLYERYRSFDHSKTGAEKAEQFENSVDDLRRDGRFAIRDLLKISRWTVELI